MQNISAQEWIQKIALPLWLDKGVDPRGGFVEALSPNAEPLKVPRRAMVQARQIYSLRLALDKNWIDATQREKVKAIIVQGADQLISRYCLPSGAFIQTVDFEGSPDDTSTELYTQAFVLFGLAHATVVSPKAEYKKRALALVRYLQKERKLSAGGFSEIRNGEMLYQSNPHMHLFEAAIAWMEIDSEPVWKQLAEDLLNLCLTRFVDEKNGTLGEHFDSQWKPLREQGRYVVEPGHLYEWAWLMGRYQKLTGKDLTAIRTKLFQTAEAHGLDPERKLAYDELWSDTTAKLKSSRFWPQAERVKCAVQMNNRPAAEEAMRGLQRFFATQVPGLWYDRMNEAGQLSVEPAKGSSLYHIIGAIAEFDSLLS